MSVVRRPLVAERVWGWMPPWSERKIRKGRSNKLAWETRFAIWKSFEPKGQLARHDPVSAGMPQHLTVVLPIATEEMEETKTDVMDQLKREGLFHQYPNLKVGFAAARFMPEGQEEEDLYVTRFFALGGPITSLDEILEVSPMTKPSSQTGFGSGYYVSSQPSTEASVAATVHTEQSTAVPSPDGEASDSKAQGKAVHVFLVDDEANIREVHRRILEGDERFVVVGEAGTAEEALESPAIKLADVVTMDIILPGMNGIEATRQLKMLYPHIKVVMVSALGGELKENSIKAGADGYVPKASAHSLLADSLVDIIPK